MVSKLELHSTSPEATQVYGAVLGKLLDQGHIITLNGDLGAGKTTFTGGVGRGWGSQQPVTSPTYVIVHVHTRANDEQQLYHLDAYRVTSDADAESIGLDDILDANGSLLIEWAAHVSDWLPNDLLQIEITVPDNHPTERRFMLTATGIKHQTLLTQFSEQVVMNAAGN